MAYYYTPFRYKYSKNNAEKLCPFCNAKMMADQSIKYADGVIAENKYYRWIINMFPKFEGHTMVVPKKHVTLVGEEKTAEVAAREELINLAADTLQKLYPGSGVEIFLQTGGGSESSVQHLHWHVVPSQVGDPLRGFDKLGHFYTIVPDQPKILIFPVPIKKARYTLQKALAKTLGEKDGHHESSSNGRRKRHSPHSA